MRKNVNNESTAKKLELLQKLEDDFTAAAAMPRYDAADIRAVYTKISAHLKRTGLPIFYQLLKMFSLHLATMEDDGISADLVQAAALGRLEAEAYFSHLCRLLPPSLFVTEYWDELEKIRRGFQYSYIQAALDSWMRAGATGSIWTPSADTPKKTAITAFFEAIDAAYSAITDAVRSGDHAATERARRTYQKLEFEKLALRRCCDYKRLLPAAIDSYAAAGDPVTVKLFLYRLENFGWDDISEKLGLTVKTCQNRYYRYIDALKKALPADLTTMAKKEACTTRSGEKILFDLEEKYQIF